MNPAPAPVSPLPGKPLRADARRNRERILKAARAVFSDQGIEAQIDDVAKRAKVGVGTVYRHFPTKEALLNALVRERFEEIAGYALEALERDDAWEGFCQAVSSTDCSAIVEDVGLMRSTELLIERAQAQGRMRLDATGEDVPIMMVGAGAVMQMSPTPDAWVRYLTLMLDGLRAS